MKILPYENIRMSQEGANILYFLTHHISIFLYSASVKYLTSYVIMVYFIYYYIQYLSFTTYSIYRY